MTQQYDINETLDTVFVDGVHKLKLDGDCVLIDMFVLKAGDNSHIAREQAAQLKIPVTQFLYMAKSMALQAEQLAGAGSIKSKRNFIPDIRQPTRRRIAA